MLGREMEVMVYKVVGVGDKGIEKVRIYRKNKTD
jgi:hypothetical protein